MTGTKSGGNLAAETNKLKYGQDFYKKIGAMGGKASGTSGFWVNRELAREAGRKGGKISKRRPRQYLCKSYYDDANVLQDCTCGKCQYNTHKKVN